MAVVHLVANGETVTKACEASFIAVSSFKAMLRKEPHLQAMLDEALQMRNDILVDMLINIDKTYSDPKMAAVISKNVQWMLERNEPEKYGQRLTLDHNNQQSKVLAEALAAAVLRIPKPREDVPMITDVTFETVEKNPAPLPAPEGVTLDQLRALGLL